MFQVVVGHSEEIFTEDAIVEVIAACDEGLQGQDPVAGLVFCGTEYGHQMVLERIRARYPGLELIGCTTDGEMSSSGGFTEDAITLTLFCSDQIQIRAGIGKRAGSEPHLAAAAAISMAKAGLEGEPKLAIVLPDGLTTSAYEVLDGFNSALGTGVPVVGGMSADRVGGSKTEYATYQFCGEQVLSDAVPVLLFSGPVAYSLGVESGWSPIGERMTVTRAEGNIVFELDERPAFELYTHYLGDVVRENLSGLGSYPLAVYEIGLERFYLRVAKAADPETGTITFLGEVPEGAQVQITQAIRDEVLAGVKQSVEQAMAGYPAESPGVAMMFSCTGRKIALGTKTREEFANVRDFLQLPVPMTGFYTFGEIGPVTEHTRARYHNTTFVTLLLGEA
ncbi:MAG: hypothetical protein DRQ37_06975 [Gammaproteobacteria bacterium]|nr:MAG: hypothetical protein DRQ37_06975 [Gammaproteobacteria bacterium]